MKANKNINYMKYALAAVWSAVLLLLGGCSKTEEGTWKQEYENCMAVMEHGISDRGMAGGQDLLDYERRARDNTVIYWQDSLNAFGECVEACIRNQSGSMAGEENVYRTATLLMAVTCEEHKQQAVAFVLLLLPVILSIHKEIRKCLFFSVYCDFLRLSEMPFPLQE